MQLSIMSIEGKLILVSEVKFHFDDESYAKLNVNIQCIIVSIELAKK